MFLLQRARFSTSVDVGSRVRTLERTNEAIESQHAFGELRLAAREGEPNMMASACAEVLPRHDGNMGLGKQSIRERLR